jgi:hypothetical protein
MPLTRPTHARLRRRVRFYGVEGPVVPLATSGVFSAAAFGFAAQTEDWFLIACSLLPALGVWGYYALFVTGRRPHFGRDVLGAWLNGRSMPATPTERFPAHPCRPPRPRGGRATF